MASDDRAWWHSLARLRFRLHHLLIAVSVLALAFAWFRLPALQHFNNKGLNGWKRVSPFTDVLVGDDGVEVEYEGSTYHLVSINDVPTDVILNSSRTHFGSQWERRFVEDLVEVLAAMGVPPETTVKVVLRNESGQTKSVRAPMTSENRQLVHKAYNARK